MTAGGRGAYSTGRGAPRGPAKAAAASVRRAILAWPWSRAHKERSEAKHEEHQWHLRWWEILGDSAAEKTPQLKDQKDIPVDSTSPHFHKALFQLTAGTTFKDFAQASARMEVMLASQRVAIERFVLWDTGESYKDVANQALVVVYQACRADLGYLPHLNPDLPSQTRECALSYEVINGFLSLGMSTPALIRCSTVSTPHSPIIYSTIWRLCDGDTYHDLARNAPELQKRLGCAWLRPWAEPGNPDVGIVIGADPGDPLSDVPSDAVRERLAEIDAAYQMG